MSDVSVEDLKGKSDSLYRLVLIGARRATQLAKHDSHALLGRRTKKPTIVALQEIVDGKLSYTTNAGDETDFLE